MNTKIAFFHFYDDQGTYRDNFIYFLSTAWNRDMDFVVVEAGKANISYPNLPNLTIITTNNINNDYGGYSQSISILKNKLKFYDEFFFINSSTRGPYLENLSKPWHDIFSEKLKDEVHLVGSSINILEPGCPDSKRYLSSHGGSEPFSHVQTTAYAMSKKLFTRLLNSGFYDIEEQLDKLDVVFEYEIGLSQRVLQWGYNLDCILPKYSGLNYRTLDHDINPTSRRGDPIRRKAYFGKTPKPSELMFIKTNRKLLSKFKLAIMTYKGLSQVEDEAILGWPEFHKLIRKSRRQIILSLIKLIAGVAGASAAAYSIWQSLF